MTSGDQKTLLRAAVAAVRDCADTMETQATSLLQALPALPMNEPLRAAALGLSAGLMDASGRVIFELALLQTELGEGKTDIATAVQRLSAMDATMMAAVAAMTDVVDELEKAAERDEQYERAFVLVIEATGVLLQGLEKAKAATQALGAAVPQAPKREPAPAADSVRMAADGSAVILQAGVEGGDVTLIGRTTDAGSWAFARVTDDQTEALFGESGDGVIEAPSFENLEWAETWDDGLRLMDRYQWARLYPLYVHPAFVERVRVAVEERLAKETPNASTERARGKWGRVLMTPGSGS